MLGVTVLVLAGCAASEDSEVAAPTVRVTETQFVTITAEPDAPSESASGSSAETEDTSEAGDLTGDPVQETDGQATEDGVPIIKPEDAGKELALADFVHPDEGWNENRFSIADKADIPGIGGTVSSCGDYGASELEMRLANKFQQLQFSVGQANASESTDQKVVVRVSGNNRQLEVYRVPFNEFQTFKVDVGDVNALTIEAYLDGEVEDCGGSVVAVFYDITLE